MRLFANIKRANQRDYESFRQSWLLALLQRAACQQLKEITLHRRHLLATIAGSAVGLSAIGDRLRADDAVPETPGIFKITPNNELHLAIRSLPVVAGNSKFTLVRLGTCKLTLDDGGRLKAVVNAAITQYTKIDYWISLAVFDEKNTFLGAANHRESIQYIRLGVMLTMLPELEFDFGISKAYKSVSKLAVAISDRNVPKPGQG